MFRRNEVDSPEALAVAAREIADFVRTTPNGLLSLDAEGLDLGRLGALTVLMIKPVDLDRLATDYPAYVIDVSTLGPAQVFAGDLRRVLESSEVTKIMFDCRSDADALQHQFGVSLAKVLDIQVFDQATRGPRAQRGPVAYVPGMAAVAPEYVSFAEISELRGGAPPPHKSDMGVWGRRPLSQQAWQYAAADVHLIELIYRSMRAKPVSAYHMQRIHFHSQRCLELYRTYPVPIVYCERFKRLILTEVALERDG